LVPARRESIIRGVVSNRQVVYQFNDEAIKEAEKIQETVETSKDPLPAARLVSPTPFKSEKERQERIREATKIYLEILAKQKPNRKSKRKSAAQSKLETNQE
jgi:hypothetical protein